MTIVTLYNGKLVDDRYIHKAAFDKGFKAFQKGNYYDNPYEDGSWAYKEWQRGQQAAYNMYYNRNVARERYRNEQL